MSEVVNVLVAFAVIIFIFRWMTSGGSEADKTAADVLGFRPKNATQQMVDTIHGMFPDIPPDNIRFDLLKTGSVETTTNKILERGFLDAPPNSYFTLYPRTPAGTATGTPAGGSSTALKNASTPSLIARYSLEDRLGTTEAIAEGEVGGKANWESTPEAREASLKERKAKMILAARQRMLAAKEKTAAPS